MKYTRGSLAEVFCHQSWRCARIVSGKGHNYIVSYDVYPGFTNEDDVERVSVKSIRPCPPQLEISECWVPGDVAEVFHNLSWKMAIILKDYGWDQFVVRLVGSLHEFEVTKSELRVRQSYQNGEWIVIGKVASEHEDANFPKMLKYDQDLHERDVYTKDSCFDTRKKHRLMESCFVSSKTLKRASPCCYSQDDPNKKRARKLRMSGKEGRWAWVPGTSPEKVDAVSNRKKCVNRSNGYESSSGSCSINSYIKHYENYHGSDFVEDIIDHESDAESVCQFEYHEESQSQSQSQSRSRSRSQSQNQSESQETDESPANDAVADEIHRLELNAYRYTMAAFHASGPLTWEKETMVTNLRMSLHISNDEHLIMIKNLISASSKTLNR